jgi:imidazoleglycerol-phosphate dehydratase
VSDRKSVIRRETNETNIHVEVDLDGSGLWEISTGQRMFDHLLSQLAQYSLFNINISATGNDQHHMVEDVAICLGRAIGESLGEKRGIVRMANASVPMDDSLANLAVDISGRGYSVLDLSLTDYDISGLESDLVRHFLESLAFEARFNLHVGVPYGNNDHHKAEAVFKALGRALGTAARLDNRLGDTPPTTKGLLES